MRKVYDIATVMLAGVLILGLAGIAGGQEFLVKDGVSASNLPQWAPGEIIVKFKPGVDERAVAAVNAAHGASVISTSRFAGFKRLRVPTEKAVAQMAAVYQRNPHVEYAEPNFIAYAFAVPDDPLYTYQWHFDNPGYGGIHLETAWNTTSGNASVVAAVIDTGVAFEDYQDPGVLVGKRNKRVGGATFLAAPDLAGTSFAPGWDFVNDDAHPNDDEGHGTHVAGTIAQSTNNGLGGAGIAYQTRIMPIKVLDAAGSGTYADIADGIYFAADNGAHIVNMSLGGSSGSTTLENAMAYAHGKGVTIVCASGNDGSATTVSYPAAYDAYAIAVGATRYDEAVAYYSNGGDSLDLTAPGGDITVDQNGDGYGDGVLQQTLDGNTTTFGYYFYQGTSMAAPHVSGVAALLMAHGVATTPEKIREVLQATARDRGNAGWDSAYGWGIVDAAAALNFQASPNTAPVANAGGPYTGAEDSPVVFDGSASLDGDDDALTYQWDFGDGSSGSGAGPAHTYTAGGTYQVTLTVNDGKVDSQVASTTALIDDVNDAPVADAGSDQTALAGVPVRFDGSLSYDPDSNDFIVDYSWDFGDDTSGSGVSPTHAYTALGTYSVILTVTDNDGLTDSAAVFVTVSDASAASTHVAAISLSTRSAGPNVNGVAVVKVVDANDVPVEGAVVSGSWSGLTGDADSGVSGLDGTVTLLSDKVKNASGSFVFTVETVAKDGWTYDAGSNVETSGEITVP